jgi:hypothetical protein
MRSAASRIIWLVSGCDVILLNLFKSTLEVCGSIYALSMFSQPEGSSTHAFLLCLGGVLLTYTHRLLLCVSGCVFTGGVFVCCGFGCAIVVVLGIYYVDMVYYWVLGSIV